MKVSLATKQTIFQGIILWLMLYSNTALLAQSFEKNVFAASHLSMPVAYEKPQDKSRTGIRSGGHERNSIDSVAPFTTPSLHGDHVEGYIIAPATRVLLSAKDESSGVAQTYYHIDENKEHLYTDAVNLASLVDGEHTLYYYSVDRHKNKEKKNTYTFYLDKIPPIISSELIGDRFIFEGKTFFSGRTKLKLTAMDNKSGVKAIYYSINGSGFQRYEKPFYIPHRTGAHYIDYYAIDYVNNRTDGRYERQVSSMYMDLTGPILTHSYSGTRFVMRNTVFVNNHTQIRLSAHDPESGTQGITYRIDGDTEQDYKEPFSLTEEGTHTIEYVGYDNVKNLNRRSFNVVVDLVGPEVFVNFSTLPVEDAPAVPMAAMGATGEGTLAVYPSHVQVFLAATDGQVGTERVYYSLNDAAEQPYRGAIGGFLEGKLYTLRVRAVDKLGNETQDIVRFIIKN